MRIPYFKAVKINEQFDFWVLDPEFGFLQFSPTCPYETPNDKIGVTLKGVKLDAFFVELT